MRDNNLRTDRLILPAGGVYRADFRKLTASILLIKDFEFISQITDFRFVSFRSFSKLQ